MAERLPLLMFPAPVQGARRTRRMVPPTYAFPPKQKQSQRFDPKFSQLESALSAERAALRATSEGAEPEKVLVFEVAGSVDGFTNAVRKAGLEWLLDIRDEDLEPDNEFYVLGDDGVPKEGKRLEHRLFLAMTDQRALQQMLSLWKMWQADQRLPRGCAPWGHVFTQLKDVRYWDASDRLDPGLAEDWHEREALGQGSVPLEVELWYRTDRTRRESAEQHVKSLIVAAGGTITDAALIEEIRYHALAGTIPSAEIDDFLAAAGAEAALVRCDNIMYFRPSGQSLSVVLLDEVTPAEGIEPGVVVGDPVVAVLDGMPVQRHALLADRLLIDDPDGWAEDYAVKDRRHGTAMASLVAHGDLADGDEPMKTPIYVRPIMRPAQPDFHGNVYEHIPDGVLPADLIRRTIVRMFEGDGDEPAAAPTVRIVNVSMGDRKRPFTRTMSPWARCLDWLAFRYGVLFVVSAGNCTDAIEVDVPRGELVGCDDDSRRDAFLAALVRTAGERRLLSPAETMNNLTVGGMHGDGSGPQDLGDCFCEPYQHARLPATYGRIGHGFRRSVKPDMVMAGGRGVYSEDIANSDETARAKLRISSRAPGHRVAAPSASGDGVSHLAGTSNAAALVTRAGARIYGDVVLPILESSSRRPLHRRHQAVLLKTLLGHSASWPEEVDLLRQILAAGGADGWAVKSWLGRMYGYGMPDVDRVCHCTDERATLVGWSDIEADEAHIYHVPMPPSLSGRRELVRMAVTVGWFSPINARSQEYRRAALSVEHPELTPATAFGAKGVDADHKALVRGTLYHRVLVGDRMSVFSDNDYMELRVNCRQDAGTLEVPVPYGLAVTLEVGEGTELPIYEEIKARIAVPVTVQP